MAERAVFLDRDGTINEEVNYLGRTDRFQLLPDAAEGIKILNALGLKIIVVTNQAGVARGYFTEATVRRLNRHMVQMLQAQGARIDAVYYCPYHPDAEIGRYRSEADCRKPRPGMLVQAAQAHDLDLRASFLVGDKLTDLQAGRAVGCTTVLVRTGYGGAAERDLPPDRTLADHVADTLFDAAQWIARLVAQKE